MQENWGGGTARKGMLMMLKCRLDRSKAQCGSRM